MTNLLTKIFIKDRKNTDIPSVRNAYATLASITGIFLNLLLFLGKLLVGLLANSVAIIADAFNNISDAGSSVIMLLGFKLSNKPVDPDHPLGHGRFEYISAFIVNVIIIIVGFELFSSSVKKIFSPTPTSASLLTIILLVAAILVKFWLFVFYKKIGKTINSSVLGASSADSISDCVATTLVLFTAIISYFNIKSSIPFDAIAGILVAAFIMYTGFNSSKETIDLLLGSSPDSEFIDRIYKFIKKYPIVLGIHDIMVHDYGPGRKIVSFHAEVPSDCDINIAHEVIDQIERDMFSEFNCIVTIHFDPLSIDDREVNEMRAIALKCVNEIDPTYSIHDFRITKGECYTNFIFDLVISHSSKLSIEDAVVAVSKKIKEHNPNYFAVIRGEYPYS